MVPKFTSPFLAATLVIYMTTATIAKTQVVRPSSVEMVAQPLVTTFSCVHNSNGFVTIARRGNRVTPPVIIWKPALGYYTPKAHCYIVSQQLTKIVSENGGKLKGLQLITGTVSDQVVVCAVDELHYFCNNSNMLFTLRSQNASIDEVVAIVPEFSGSNSLRLEDLNRFLGPEN